MHEEDKLMGLREKKRVYASYRVDYNSKKDVREEITSSGAVKVPPKGYEPHSTKQGYQRKAICEKTSDKDSIVQWCDNNNIDYSVESITVSKEEKEAFEAYEAENGVQAKKAVKWLQGLKDLSNGNISKKDFELGKNTYREEEFKPPNQSKGRK